jgi:hypothetical protein
LLGITLATNLEVRKHICHVLPLLLAQLHTNLVAWLPDLLNANHSVPMWPDQNMNQVAFLKWRAILLAAGVIERTENTPSK